MLFVLLNSALKQIRNHLYNGHHKKALAVLKAAMVTWPEYKMFVCAERDPEQQQDEERYTNHCAPLYNGACKCSFLNCENESQMQVTFVIFL